MVFDLFFYYKYLIRYIIFLNEYFQLKYYDNILKINKLVIYFNINKSIDINTSAILSSFFFFKYYFGVIPFFNKYQSEFKLNIYYYSFSIEYIFKNIFIYYSLYFFINDIYFMINKLSIQFSKFQYFWEIYIKDMNFFLEKKNSLGFFYLKYHLFFNLFFDTKYNLLNLLKLQKQNEK